jgi:hypothetical protein
MLHNKIRENRQMEYGAWSGCSKHEQKLKIQKSVDIARKIIYHIMEKRKNHRERFWGEL